VSQAHAMRRRTGQTEIRIRLIIDPKKRVFPTAHRELRQRKRERERERERGRERETRGQNPAMDWIRMRFDWNAPRGTRHSPNP